MPDTVFGKKMKNEPIKKEFITLLENRVCAGSNNLGSQGSVWLEWVKARFLDGNHS
jgi:hypothetical protein